MVGNELCTIFSGIFISLYGDHIINLIS